MSNYTCHSGGCPGADMNWEAIGNSFGVETIAYSFEGHTHQGRNPYIMSAEQLNEGWDRALMASETLKRPLSDRWPPHYVKNLLSRNWYQIKNSTDVFAIGMFENKRKDRVKGGTGWAVQMAVDCREGRNIFLFDQAEVYWHLYDAASRRFIPYHRVPTLSEDFAGIGTRSITLDGIRAIRNVYEEMHY